METRTNHRSEVGVFMYSIEAQGVRKTVFVCLCSVSDSMVDKKGTSILSHELMLTDTFTHTQIHKPCSLCVCFLFCYSVWCSFYFSHHIHLLKMLLYSCLLSFCIVCWSPYLLSFHTTNTNLIVISIFVLFFSKNI